MKAGTMLTVLVGILLPLTVACQSKKAPVPPPDFSPVMESEWVLSEIRASGRTIVLDWEHNDEVFGEIFTIRFEETTVFGIGAPNSYRGPYTREDDRLSFGPAASTLMAAFLEPEELTEYEFFGYLAATVSWDLEDGNLLLYTSGEGGGETVLVFVPL